MSMEQGNPKGPDKRNWRERLGISGKENMPKISDEFRAQTGMEDPARLPSRAAAGRPASPIRPAPMAPRPAVKRPASLPASLRPSSLSVETETLPPQDNGNEGQKTRARPVHVSPPPLPQSLKPAGRPSFAFADEISEEKEDIIDWRKAETPTSFKNQTQLEDKAKSARDRPSAPSPRPVVSPSRLSGQLDLSLQTELGAAPAVSSRRYVPSTKSQQGAALGSSAPLTSTARAKPAVPVASEPPPQPYRSPHHLDAPIATAPSLTRPAAPVPRSAATSAPLHAGKTLSEPRLTGAREAYSSYRRDEEVMSVLKAPETVVRPGEARRAVRPLSLSAKSPDYHSDELDELFEDSLLQARRRSVPEEYNQAYQEEIDEPDYHRDYDARRIWMPLFAIISLIILGGIGYWIYQMTIQSSSGPIVYNPQSSPGEVPVVSAPEEPAKTLPQATEDQQPTAAFAKKQIYDRIVGEQEVLGNSTLAPTQEPPKLPPQAPNTPQGRAPNQPSEQQSSAGGSGAVPLPVPPSGSSQQMGLISLPPAPAQQASAPQQIAANQLAVSMFLPSVQNEPSAAQQEVQPSTTSQQQTTPPLQPEESAQEAPSPPAPRTVKSHAPARKASKTAPPSKASTRSGLHPTALSAKEQIAKKPDEVDTNSATTAAALVPAVEKTIPQTAKPSPAGLGEGPIVLDPSVKKPPQTLAQLFSRRTQSRTNARQHVAAIGAESDKAAVRSGEGGSSSSSGSYAVQLASFRTQGEAQSEYTRLRGAHSNIVGGLSPQISQGKVAGSTRYRLAVGPLSSRNAASKLCDALLVAGERDCLIVKR